MTNTSAISRILAVLLALLLALPYWMLAAVGEPQLPDPGTVRGFTRDQQVQLGQKAVAEVYKQKPILPDSSPITQYVAQLGRKLETVIPRQYSWPYQFHVVQEQDINAFALPGGPVFVNVGTILAADNEAQLAGVMAHEMSHVYMQHSVKGAEKQGTTQALGQILGGILGATIGGAAGAVAQAGMQIGAGMVSLKYSRADEAQADAVGAIIMYRAGYNPIALPNFFHKLEQEGASGPQYLSDHPNPGNRVQAISKEIRDWPARQYLSDNVRFDQAKQESRGVRAYSAQQIQQMAQSGQIRNASGPQNTQEAPSGEMGAVPRQEVMPSGNYQQLNQAGMTIEYPSNWQVMGSGQGGVTIAPQAGISQGNVAYGVIIGGFTSRNASTLNDAMNQLVASLQQSNPDLRAVGSAQTIRVNGVSGRSLDLLGTSPVQSPNGQPLHERDWIVALPTDNRGSLVYLIFVSPDRDSQQLRPTFEHMLKSFRLQQ